MIHQNYQIEITSILNLPLNIKLVKMERDCFA